MKKLLSSLAAGTIMAVAFFGVNTFLLAANSGAGTNLSSIVEAQNSGLNLNIEKAHAYHPSGIANPTCTDNYSSWSSSNTFTTEADWSTWFVMILSMPNANSTYSDLTNNFERDINGDGLADYILVDHHYNYYTNFVEMTDCVFLSNGSGWDLAYKCVARSTASPKYYGDCADV
jgi:hypothetical protein